MFIFLNKFWSCQILRNFVTCRKGLWKWGVLSKLCYKCTFLCRLLGLQLHTGWSLQDSVTCLASSFQVITSEMLPFSFSRPTSLLHCFVVKSVYLHKFWTINETKVACTNIWTRLCLFFYCSCNELFLLELPTKFLQNKLLSFFRPASGAEKTNTQCTDM